MRTYTLTGFSDEIAPAMDVQLHTLRRLGVPFLELRGVDGKNIADLTVAEAGSLKTKLDAAGVGVSAIGSPIGKIKITQEFAPHFALFQNTVAVAKVLGTRYIRLFSFFVEGEASRYRDEVMTRLQALIAYAKQADIVLLHENEKDIYGDTAPRCLDLMETLGGPHFGAVFDFANFVQCGQETLAAYRSLAPYVKYIHIKDAVGAQVVPAGMGEGKVREILRQVLASGYQGFLSLEPHLADFAGFSALENGRKKGEKWEDGAFAWELALAALKGILYDLEGETPWE